MFLLPVFQVALVAMRRYLDWSTCNYLSWVPVANLLMKHAFSFIVRMNNLYSKTPFLTDGQHFLSRIGHFTPRLCYAFLLT
jgi:hypothetical protein